MKMDEKAVSEAIGFILILGLVLTGIALVTLYGYSVLVKEQSSTDVKNMERAMIVIQNDMKSLCFKNVPYKESTLQVSGGTLEVIGSKDGASPEFEISGAGFDTVTFSPGALIYRSDRSTEVITLENGAVMTRQEGAAGSAMLAEPRWFYDEPTKTFVVYIMNITTDEPMAKSGMATVRMKLNSSNTQAMPVSYGNKVTVRYVSGSSGDHSVAWENYLTALGMRKTALNEYEWNTANKPVGKLIIKEYKIKILGI